MSPDLDVSPAGDSSTASVQSPGSLIRQGRDRMHVSLDELAALTKLSYHTLEALERDDYNALLEPVYVRGYYRKCAKVLNLPEQALLDAYQSRVAPKTPEPPAKIRLASGADLGSTTPRPIFLAIGLALLAVIVGAVVWVARSGTANIPAEPVELTTPTPASQPSSEAAPAVGESVTVPATQLVAPTIPTPTPAPDATATATATPTAEAAPAAPAVTAPAPVPPAASATPAPSATAPSAPAPETAAASAPLVLSFSGTSWVRVSDAKGNTAIDGLVRSGESKTIDGVPPFSVFLGNAAAAKVEYQGASVDITPYVRSNKTARFTVPATP